MPIVENGCILAVGRRIRSTSTLTWCPPKIMQLPSTWRKAWHSWNPLSDQVLQHDLVVPGFERLHEIEDADRDFWSHSYPRNHNFVLGRNRLIPSRRLSDRLRQLTVHYPRSARSLVDLSCSKGYFVFHARCQMGMERVLGIDIDRPTLEKCQLLNAHFGLRENTTFAESRLRELSHKAQADQADFDVGLLVNTYQYLRLGSSLEPAAGNSHRELFYMLSQVCRGRLIFHNRLEFTDLQDSVQQEASVEGSKDYHPGEILTAASEFFQVRKVGGSALRPILLLDNRRGYTWREQV